MLKQLFSVSSCCEKSEKEQVLCLNMTWCLICAMFLNIEKVVKHDPTESLIFIFTHIWIAKVVITLDSLLD